MRWLLVLLAWLAFPSASAETSRFQKAMDDAIERYAPLEFLQSSTRLVHPMSSQTPVIWFYWLEEADDVSLNAWAVLTDPGQRETYGAIDRCHLRRELNLAEQEMLRKFRYKSTNVTCEGDDTLCLCKTIDDAPRGPTLCFNGVCIGGSSRYVQLSDSDGEIRTFIRACGQNDVVGMTAEYIESLMHPHYQRPHEDCADNRTPEFRIPKE